MSDVLTLVSSFRKRMKEEIEYKKEALTAGQIKTLEQYQSQCAYIQAMGASLDVFNEVVHKLEADED